VPGFVPADAADLILGELIERQAEFRARGRGASGRPAFHRMATALGPCPALTGRIRELVPLLERRFDTDLRGAYLELRGQAYGDGCWFARHTDAGAGGPNWQRRLSGIYYVHVRPRRFEGGALVLHDRRGVSHRLEPDHNSAVFFPRDLAHEVLPVSCASPAFEHSRFAINIWIG
jgi:hypothetical protein